MMMPRFLAVIPAAVFGLSLVGSATPATTAGSVPRDVQQALATEYSIAVSAVSAPPGVGQIRPAQAIAAAKRRFYWGKNLTLGDGWVLPRTVSARLVRLGDKPDGKVVVDTHPLGPGSLAWLVIIRNADIPVLGPPGGNYIATMAVLVEASRPHAVVGVAI
jgi:hypothetical protein